MVQPVLQAGSVPHGEGGHRIYSEFFIDARGEGDEPVTLYQNIFQTEADGIIKHPANWECNLNKSLYKTWYKTRQSEWPEVSVEGDKTIPLMTDVVEWLGEPANSKIVVSALMDLTTSFYSLYCSNNATSTNDGYWVAAAPCATIMAYFCPIEYAYEFMNCVRNDFPRKMEWC